MTGFELYKKVCTLLGCYDLTENQDNGKSTAFLNMLNQICNDLNLKEIGSLTDAVLYKENQKEALIYGCAMLFSVTLRDSGCAKIYTQLYNSKRAKALSQKDTRKDTLPAPSVGGM